MRNLSYLQDYICLLRKCFASKSFIKIWKGSFVNIFLIFPLGKSSSCFSLKRKVRGLLGIVRDDLTKIVGATCDSVSLGAIIVSSAPVSLAEIYRGYSPRQFCTKVDLTLKDYARLYFGCRPLRSGVLSVPTDRPTGSFLAMSLAVFAREVDDG